MTQPELIERVCELRQRGRTPKEIARILGLPPAAARIIRTMRRSVGDDNFHYLGQIV
jgi:hypothetical protein